MNEVYVKKDDGQIRFIEISGHADFANYGEDVVCSAISAVVFGSLNSLVEFGLNEKNIQIDEAFIRIESNMEYDINLICKNMIIQLETIQGSYPEYIKIKSN